MTITLTKTMMIVMLMTLPVAVSRCEVCDDDVAGQECDVTADVHNCLGATPYCFTRVTDAQPRMRVQKGYGALGVPLKSY